MGLLSEGSPLSWEETKKWANHVKTNGIEQFINLFNRLKERKGDSLKWGDEVEYVIVQFDHEKKRAKVSLRANEMLPILREAENRDPTYEHELHINLLYAERIIFINACFCMSFRSAKFLWRPEYGAYMVEVVEMITLIQVFL